ncbi:hypothetical protein ACFW17_03840 [Streptomyces sp. NPDC058961]|uniref:hypothetical protein n=1 Tax=Streptomyces sp. NPDC058961 TaxID=3346680 RepID=UPI00368F1CF4
MTGDAEGGVDGVGAAADLTGPGVVPAAFPVAPRGGVAARCTAGAGAGAGVGAAEFGGVAAGAAERCTAGA